ncbi:putative adenylate kinase 7, mitochondrial [Iris pallida]|uniref:adenylate kinase n=1 Tax=Iris pallida TaxID=29817 RepID=A0AAX6EWY5_IRIPA|nr:putative adenylate kinase 7, mitochondrial [Iris pallida]
MAGVISRSAAATAAGSILRRIVSYPPPSSCPARSLSAAAAVEVDFYDSEWEEEEERERGRRRTPPTAKDMWREMEGRGVQWVFMGRPGAQKHAHATRLAELLEVPYISMGTLVRQELDPTSSLYMKIANAVNEGKLVPEDIIFGLLSKRLEEGYHRGETGFILDGIPRTRVQAEILDQIADIDLVVNFKSVEDCLVKKHFGSHICAHCGKSFYSSDSESTSQNPCLATRTRHTLLKSSAATDTKVSMEKFHIYTEQSKLLEEYYRKQKKLLNFHVAGGPGETWQGLLAALHLQHIDVANSSRKLTI